MSNLDLFQDAVNNAIRSNKNIPVTVSMQNESFTNINRARQYKGRQFGSSKLYTDIILDRNGRSVRIALKEDVIKEVYITKKVIDLIVPGLADKFIRAVALKVRSLGLSDDDTIPNTINGRINSSSKKKLITGNQSMGGPIDFVYEGSIQSEYDEESQTINFSGSVIDSDTYSKNKEIYLSISLKSGSAKYKTNMTNDDVQRLYDTENITITETLQSDMVVDLR
jgi:hypothetical protein